MKKLTLLTVFLLSGTARGDADRCVAGLVAANASMATAKRVAAQAWDPDEVRVASAMVKAAEAQVRAALALCPAPKQTSPVDPWEVQAPAPQAPLNLVPVPGVPYLVDPVVERECPGPLCPIVIIVPR